MSELVQNTAVTISVGQFVDWADGKTLLTANADFDPTKITAILYKNGVGAAITLAKTGVNAINLSGLNDGMATLTLTAGNVDTLGTVQISFANTLTAGVSSDYILPFTAEYDVVTALTEIARQTISGTLPTDYGTVLDIATAQRQAALYQLAAFGEQVTYKPFGAATRAILAMVERNPVGKLYGAKDGVGPNLTVAVANSAVDGIASSEINTGNDKITLPVRLGQTAQDRLITKIISQDRGMLLLEVR
jgi:hypothetical protein